MNERYEAGNDDKGGGSDDGEPGRRGIDVNFNFGEPGGWLFLTLLMVLVYRCNGVGLW